MSKEPINFRKAFNKFSDARGFLSASDYRDLDFSINLKDFHYQLLSHTEHSNTFRGFHYQEAPYEQEKIIFLHCGKIIDIVFPLTLKADCDVTIIKLCPGDVLFVPKGYAHGFISLCDNVVLQYLMNKPFSPKHYTGINGTKAIAPAYAKCLMSEKDAELPSNLQVDKSVKRALIDWIALNSQKKEV